MERLTARMLLILLEQELATMVPKLLDMYSGTKMATYFRTTLRIILQAASTATFRGIVCLSQDTQLGFTKAMHILDIILRTW